MAGVGEDGRRWAITPATALVIDRGEAEEAVVVASVTAATFTALFRKPHARGFAITARGNPGPWPRFQPARHPEVVPYFSVID
jgi:hypothetical protein